MVGVATAIPSSSHFSLDTPLVALHAPEIVRNAVHQRVFENSNFSRRRKESMFRRNVSSKIPRNDAKEMAKKTNAWMKRDPDGEERKEKKGKKRIGIRVRGCHRKISRHDCESRGERRRNPRFKRRDERSRYERMKKSGGGGGGCESWSSVWTVSARRRIRTDVPTKPLLPPSLFAFRSGKFEK